MPRQENGIYILEVSGTPYERGVQHGEQLKDVIIESMDLWKENIADFAKTNEEEVLKRFIGQTKSIDTLNIEVPDLMEELKGIAEGADVDYNELLAFQMFDDVITFLIENYQAEVTHCTTIAYRSENRNIVSGNSDLLTCYKNSQVMLKIKYDDSDLEIRNFTFAGMLSQGGMNNRGVSLMINTLLDANTQNKGMSSAFICRKLLEKNNVIEAIEYLKRIQHSCGINYVLGDYNDVVSVECSKNSVEVIEVSKGEKFIHTNHCLKNEDLSGFDMKATGDSDAAASFGQTYERYDYGSEKLKEIETLEIEDIKSILCAEPIFVKDNGLSLSAASIICDIKKDELAMYYAAYPLNENNYVKFGF